MVKANPWQTPLLPAIDWIIYAYLFPLGLFSSHYDSVRICHSLIHRGEKHRILALLWKTRLLQIVTLVYSDVIISRTILKRSFRNVKLHQYGRTVCPEHSHFSNNMFRILFHLTKPVIKWEKSFVSFINVSFTSLQALNIKIVKWYCN